MLKRRTNSTKPFRNEHCFTMTSNQLFSRCQSCVSLLIILSVTCGYTQDIYCETGGSGTTFVDVNDTGVIHTRLKNTEYYGNHFDCKWILNAGPNKKIFLTILGTQLQWAPENSICTGGYDHIHIKDGKDKDSPTAALWCGKRNPYTVTSTERYLYIRFQTNDKNPYNYRGADIQFQAFDSMSCPPGWLTQSDSDPYCYNVHTQSQSTWSNAQVLCNFNQANLVAITTKTQQDYFKAQTQSLSGSTRFWIGVNKIALEHRIVYLNGSQVPMQFFKTQDFPSNEDCIALDLSDDSWFTAHCTRVHLPFICQSNKTNTTMLYKVPEGKREVGEQTKVPIILAGVLGSLVVIGAIIGGILIYMKCFANKSQNRGESNYRPQDQNSHSDTDTSNQASRPLRDERYRTRQTLNTPQSRDPPPTYEEAVLQKDMVV